MTTASQRRALRWGVQSDAKPLPKPTDADLAATVYALSYGSLKNVWVLALDGEHAKTLGKMRLRSMGQSDIAPSEIVAHQEASVEMQAAILGFETDDERQDRQDAYAARTNRAWDQR